MVEKQLRERLDIDSWLPRLHANTQRIMHISKRNPTTGSCSVYRRLAGWLVCL